VQCGYNSLWKCVVFKGKKKIPHPQLWLGFWFHQSKLLFLWNPISNPFDCRRACQETCRKMWSNKRKGTHWRSLRLIVLKGTTDIRATSFYGKVLFVIVTSTPTIITAEKRPGRIDFFCRFWVSFFWALNTVNFLSRFLSKALAVPYVHWIPLWAQWARIRGKSQVRGQELCWSGARVSIPSFFKDNVTGRMKMIFFSREMGR